MAWRFRTNKGRVVYDAPPHMFSRADVLRVYRGWLDQASLAEITLTAWELWLLSGQAARDRAFPPLRWIREWLKRIGEQVLSDLVSWETAPEVLELAGDLNTLSEQLTVDAVALRPSLASTGQA